jgi:hypothetical protein
MVITINKLYVRSRTSTVHQIVSVSCKSEHSIRESHGFTTICNINMLLHKHYTTNLIHYTFHASVFDMPREIISKCIWYGDRLIQG